MTGSCASQSISRSGWSARSSRAMATSRSAWPRPIGLEMKSARRGRPSARGQTRRAGGEARKKSRSRRLVRTGCRAPGPWPVPSKATSSEPAIAAWTRSEISIGRIRSAEPWIRSVGTWTRARISGSGVRQRASSMLEIRTSGVVSSAHETPSSRCLVECGSGNASAEEELGEVAVVVTPVVRVELLPSVVRCARRRERRDHPAARDRAPHR